jgi:hypothetical protein
MIEENTAEKLFDYLVGYSSSSILSALCLIILLVEGFNRSTDKQLNELTEHQPLKLALIFGAEQSIFLRKCSRPKYAVL